MVESVDLIIRQTGHPERVVKLQEGVSRLGRAEDNDLVLADVGVSRRHARLVVTKESVRFEDLGSGNGTYYKGFRVQSQDLDDGDELVVDPFVLQFRIKGAVRKEGGAAAPPASPTSVRLDVIAGAGLARPSYAISSRGLTMGRSETRDVVVPDPAASRHHCSVVPRENSWVLRDMGSANGVYVNGVRVRESLLADGDRIRIGNTEFRFTLGDAAQLDSTTSRSTRESWAQPGPEASDRTPKAPDTPTPQARSRLAGRLIAGGVTVLVALAALALLLVLGGVVALVSYQQANVGPKVPVRDVHPPGWHVELPGGLPSSDVKTLQTQGMEALRKGDNKTALVDFFRILQAEPGKASAERLAFAAGEYLVLEQLQVELKANGEARVAREKKRDDLLKVALGSTPAKRAATDTLAAEFRDDAVVVEKMSWTPSEASLKVTASLTDAAAKQDHNAWADAARVYREVYLETRDPAARQASRAGMKATRRELAREIGLDWRKGVVAMADGDDAAARAAFETVKKTDPDNPSVRLRAGALPEP